MDFKGCTEHGDEHRRALLRRCRRTLPEPSLDVLDDNNGVVHEHADRDGEAAQGHGVDCEAKNIQHEHGGEEREWNRHYADNCGTEAPKEKKEDHNHQGCPIAKHPHDVGDGRVDEVFLPEDFAMKRHPTRSEIVIKRVEGHIEPIGGRQRVGLRLLDDADEDRGLGVVTRRAARERRTLLDRRHITNAHRRAIPRGQDDGSEVVNAVGTTEHAHNRLLSAIHHVAPRGVVSAAFHALGDVIERQFKALHAMGIHQDLVALDLTANGHGLRDASD